MKKHGLVVAVVVLAALAGTPAWAGWGCGYSSSGLTGVTGRQWSHPDEQTARKVSMDACKSLGHKKCHIIGCSAGVDSKEDADRLWALPAGSKPMQMCGSKKC